MSTSVTASTRVRASDIYEYDTSGRTQLWRRKWTPAAENSDETDAESGSEYDDDNGKQQLYTGATPDSSDVDSEFDDSRKEYEFRGSTAVRAVKPSRTFDVGVMAVNP